MAETANLLLPFLAAGQAQKHLTVNDALERLDVLLMLSVASRTRTAPPPAPSEGARWIVPAGAGGDWAGEAGRIAAWLNGGWRFFAPRPGWRAFVEDEGGDAVFASGVWQAAATGGGGGATLSELEFEHVIAPGSSDATAATIPAGAMVFAVTARVLEEIVGPTSWSLGVAGAPTRYGAGLSTGAGAVAEGASGAPLAYGAATPLRLGAEGADFVSGRVLIRVSHLAFPAPGS